MGAIPWRKDRRCPRHQCDNSKVLNLPYTHEQLATRGPTTDRSTEELGESHWTGVARTIRPDAARPTGQVDVRVARPARDSGLVGGDAGACSYFADLQASLTIRARRPWRR